MIFCINFLIRRVVKLTVKKVKRFKIWDEVHDFREFLHCMDHRYKRNVKKWNSKNLLLVRWNSTPKNRWNYNKYIEIFNDMFVHMMGGGIILCHLIIWWKQCTLSWRFCDATWYGIFLFPNRSGTAEEIRKTEIKTKGLHEICHIMV